MKKQNTPTNTPDSPFSNLFEQAANISKAHAYDILVEQVGELKEENERLKEALQGIINNWDERMSGDKEVWKDEKDSVSGHGYYSPSSSMVSSEFIAKARTALNHKP